MLSQTKNVDPSVGQVRAAATCFVKDWQMNSNRLIIRNRLFVSIRFAIATIITSASLGYADDDVNVNSIDSPAVGRQGMVSSAHPIATQAGIEMLQRGGNAFDAAVAIAATLNVVEPYNSGLGGYGLILIYDAQKEQSRVLNCSGRIPRNVNSDVFRAPTPNYEQNRKSAKAVSTPTNLNAWWQLSTQYGKLKWSKLFDSAIESADNGFVVSERTSAIIAKYYPDFPQHAKDFYGRNEVPLKPGERLVQNDLAKSFQLVAKQGPGALYGGVLGEAIDSTMRKANGFLSMADLKANEAEWSEPISISYRDHEIVTAAPPANSFSSLIRLGMMTHFDNHSLGHNTVPYLHRFAEVTKHAFWCRLKYAGDPDVKPPPLGRLLSDSYLSDQVSKIDLTRAKPFVPPGPMGKQGAQTTHFVVADRDGNIVCATQTLGTGFGSMIMPEGTGIWLNNSLNFCTFEPKGNPMDAHAGRRKLISNHPTFVMKRKKPWIAIGTPGGHTIGQTVPQMIINSVDFGMDIQNAIAAPRVSFVEPDSLSVEEGISESIRNQLSSMGHNVKIAERIGKAHGLTIEFGAGGRPTRFTGGADPRGEGQAVGY